MAGCPGATRHFCINQTIIRPEILENTCHSTDIQGERCHFTLAAQLFF